MEIELTEVCQELRNWFDREHYFGRITLAANGDVYCNGVAIGLLDGQYFRVTGSVFADGVHKYPDTQTVGETFDGAVWAMAVPASVIKLATEIAEWRAKYEAPDAASMSPYMAESFGGYSYSKGSSYTGAGSGGGTSWKSAFAAKLNAWRKI